MNRREALKAGGAVGAVGIAGCLGFFETESVWRNAPLVEDRPDAVYLPAGKEAMGTYGRARTGRYAVALQYTFPHRFWTVSGTSTSKVEVTESDAVHLMVTVWDAESGVVLPAEPSIELRHGGSVVASRTLWSMLSQRMGFHYGDNLELDEEGHYEATVRLSPVDADPVGDLAGQFGDAASATIEFEYDADDVYDLEYTLIDEGRRGSRDAVPLMGHSHGGGSDGHGGPKSTVPPPDELPGESLGTATSGDAAFVATLVPEGSRFADDGQYLLASPRTPYNSIPIPLMGLSATVTRDEGSETVFEDSLPAAIDGEVGLHYGTEVGTLEAGDAVTVSVTSPPQASRHDGYETAFFEMAPMEFVVGR